VRPWWLRLAPFALKRWPGLSAVLALTLLGVATELLTPWPLKLVVDYVFAGQLLSGPAAWISASPGAGGPTAALAWLASASVAFRLANRLCAAARKYVQSGIGTRVTYELGAELFERLQRLSLRFHGQQQTGDLARRVTRDSSCIRDLALDIALPVVTSLVSLVAMFTVMWQLDPALSLLALLVVPPFVFLTRLLARPIAGHSYEQQKLEGQLMAVAEQTLTALPVVQAFSRERDETERFRNLARRTASAYGRTITAQQLFAVGTGTITALGTAAMMGVGGLHVSQGSLSVGSLVVLLAYLSSLYAPLQTLASVAAGFASAAARARRVLEVLGSEEGVRDAPGARPLPAGPPGRRGHVRLERVTFGYEPARPVLHAVSLEARPGETLALVGPSGAGKSTLVSLILRFFDPWEGRVSIDGLDLRRARLASLRAQVALVLQEPFLLPLTVAENIAYGRPGAGRAEVVAAAAAANADAFIRRLPRGYDTPLGERGATLSGGERQRLAIARALLKDAPVLILDEPTAALDAGTEALLLEALARLMVGRTTFIIAHRLSTVRGADRVAVLDAGRLLQLGTPAELLAADGLYRRLHHLQLGATPPPREVPA